MPHNPACQGSYRVPGSHLASVDTLKWVRTIVRHPNSPAIVVQNETLHRTVLLCDYIDACSCLTFFSWVSESRWCEMFNMELEERLCMCTQFCYAHSLHRLAVQHPNFVPVWTCAC